MCHSELLLLCSRIASGSLVGGRVLAEPRLEGSEISFATVVDTILVVLGIELEGGVATDLEASDLVDGGIELGDDQVLDTLDVLGELLPYGGELFAVTAPGSVVLDEHILGGVLDYVVE